MREKYLARYVWVSLSENVCVSGVCVYEYTETALTYYGQPVQRSLLPASRRGRLRYGLTPLSGGSFIHARPDGQNETP